VFFSVFVFFFFFFLVCMSLHQDDIYSVLVCMYHSLNV